MKLCKSTLLGLALIGIVAAQGSLLPALGGPSDRPEGIMATGVDPGTPSTTQGPPATSPPAATQPPPPTTTNPPPPTLTSDRPIPTSPPSSQPPVVQPTKSSSSRTTSSSSAQPSATPCSSSSSCGENQICALVDNAATQGTCRALTSSMNVCVSSPAKSCSSSADCTSPEYSYCGEDPLTKSKVCTGLGRPGTPTECISKDDGTKKDPKSSLTKTLTYAGIAVGVVVVLAIAFALFRWRRNRRESKMPESMFGDIDYGMSDRQRNHRRSTGTVAGAAALAATGAASTGAGQAYPFSSRPHAQGTTEAHAGYGQDEYYDESYANNHNGNKMHPDPQFYGQEPYDAQYDQQYYDQPYYDPYAKEGYGGYDPQQQQGQYGMRGAPAVSGPGVASDGYYDQAGYEEYPTSTSHAAAASGVHHSPPAIPTTAATSYGVDHYGAEPSEMNYSGAGGSGARTAPVRTGFDPRY